MTNYKHELTEFAGRNCIIIEDLNQGGMSVTNNIENIIAEIQEKDRIDASTFMIVYKDSDGKWDGWDYKTQSFISLQCDNQWHGIRRFIKKQLNNIP